MESPDPRDLIARIGGGAAGGWAAALDQAFASLDHPAAGGPVVIAQEDYAAYLAAAFAALHRRAPVALANPRWGAAERAQAAAQLRPGRWLGAAAARWPDAEPAAPWAAEVWAGTILIPTGGTGGRVRWAVHDWGTLCAAALGLEKFLGDGPFTHVSTLPPWHVSGLMPAVRALATGGALRLENWESLERGGAPECAPGGSVISLVPTQLRRLLPHTVVTDWLRGTRAILLGGAPAAPDLLHEARALRLPVAPAYGMTETAAVVAAQLPEHCARDAPASAQPLPHARIAIVDDCGATLPADIAGRIRIETTALFLGYFPQREKAAVWVTEDEGLLDAQGRLRVLGRLDRCIITGGEKVDPQLVEQAVLSAGLAEEALVVGVPHPDWGQAVTALYSGAPLAEDDFKSVLSGMLPGCAIPKRWIRVERLPLNAHGKLDRAALGHLLRHPQ